MAPLATMVQVDREIPFASFGNIIERENGHAHARCLEVGYQGTRWWLGDEPERLGYPSVRQMTVVKANSGTRLFILGALAAMGGEGIVEVCIGLPVALFEQQREEMTRLLAGSHDMTIGGDGREMVLRGMIVPEGYGLLVQASVSKETGLDDDLLGRSTAVLDFGQRTTQLALFRGKRMNPVSCSLHHAADEVFEGVLRDEVDAKLGSFFDPIMHAVMAQDLVLKGSVTVGSLTLTYERLLPVLQVYASRLWPRIEEEISRVLTGMMVERVVAGGGGVHLFAEKLKKRFGDGLVLLPDRFAQAEGYRLCVMHRSQLMG
jgi:hypothetical protein